MSISNPPQDFTSSSKDVWDNYVPPQRSSTTAPKAQVVRDSWDDDDEDDEDEEPQKLWEAANNLAPMPELVISSSGTASSAVPPPPAAFQPSMKILKRPSSAASPSASVSSSSSDLQKSLAKREAEYQEARQRIFGDQSSSLSKGGSGSSTKLQGSSSPSNAQRTPPATILRNPRGPESPPDQSKSRSSNDGASKGFRSRRGGEQGRVPKTTTNGM